MPEQIHFRSAASASLRLNGKRLAGILTRIITERADSDTERSKLLKRLATAAGITADQVQQILDGDVDFPPADWIRVFSSVLRVDDFLLAFAASGDASDFTASLSDSSEAEVMRQAARSVVSNCQCQQEQPEPSPMPAMLRAAAGVLRADQ